LVVFFGFKLTCRNLVSDVTRVHVLVERRVTPLLQRLDDFLDAVRAAGNLGTPGIHHPAPADFEGESSSNGGRLVLELHRPNVLKSEIGTNLTTHSILDDNNCHTMPQDTLAYKGFFELTTHSKFYSHQSVTSQHILRFQFNLALTTHTK